MAGFVPVPNCPYVNCVCFLLLVPGCLTVSFTENTYYINVIFPSTLMLIYKGSMHSFKNLVCIPISFPPTPHLDVFTLFLHNSEYCLYTILNIIQNKLGVVAIPGSIHYIVVNINKYTPPSLPH